MSIKIEMLRCFSVVAQSGNLTEASTRMGRTPSAVSMMLKQLEEELGQKLFEGERKNRLSLLGEQVYELAQKQLQHFDATLKAIEASANSPQGLIRVASVPSVAGLVFPTAIRELIDRHPGLRVDLRDTDSQQVIDALLQGQADIGIASGQHALNGIRQAPLFSDRFGLICAPDHALARQADPPTIAEVAAAGFVMNNLCGLIETPAFREATQSARVAVHNTMSLIAMVQAHNWVTVLPQTVVQLMPAGLVFREIADLPDLRHVCLFLRDRSPFLHFAEELAGLITGFDWAGLVETQETGCA